MMQCGQCGHISASNDTECHKCGKKMMKKEKETPAEMKQEKGIEE